MVKRTLRELVEGLTQLKSEVEQLSKEARSYSDVGAWGKHSETLQRLNLKRDKVEDYWKQLRVYGEGTIVKISYLKREIGKTFGIKEYRYFINISKEDAIDLFNLLNAKPIGYTIKILEVEAFNTSTNM